MTSVLSFDIQKPVVNYAFDWLILIQLGTNQMLCLQLSVEFQRELLNFIEKFGTTFATF